MASGSVGATRSGADGAMGAASRGPDGISAGASRAASRVRLVLAFLATALVLVSASRALANRVALDAVLGPGFLVLAAATCAALVLAVLELAAARRSRESSFVAARLAFVALVAWWIAFAASVHPFQRLWLDLALAPLAGLWIVLSFALRRLSARVSRGVERSLFVAALSLAALECGLRVASRTSDASWMATADETSRARIERFRCAPGLVHQGFVTNSRGFVDVEFARRAPGEQLVAVIGDSFCVGAVPHAFHFTTVAERELGFEVANVGVAGVGPREYEALLVDEVLPLDPSVVVASLFVGNDLSAENVVDELPDAALRAWFSRERVLVLVVPRRLARLRAEPALESSASSGSAIPVEELAQSFPWLVDPARELPTLSEEAHLRLETQRALEIARSDPPGLTSAIDALVAMRDACGTRPFGVLLVPDELQVEDELFAAVAERANVPLDRERIQRVVAERLRSEGIACLDLLPALRALPPLADGRKHVYHRRDTHFNARGNRVAGEQLAAFVARLLAR